MLSIGADIVTISRVAHWIKDSDYLSYIYTKNERTSCLNMKLIFRHLAVSFAVKEAFMKAIGTGWGSGVQWKDIELLRQKGGESVRLYNRAKQICGDRKVFVSTACTRVLAAALVVISDDE